MTNLADLADLEPIQVWDGVRVRRIEGDQVTLAVVELDPNQVVPEHTHPNEQNGLVLVGEMRLRVDDEERVLGPGGTWQIMSNVPHAAQAGPDGAVVIDVFSPIRSDWDSRPTLERTAPRWP
jgi:quercetin dioxygenase-like cupin family protein